MHARIHHHCQPRSKRADYESEDIVIDVNLPFVPAAGTLLIVNKDSEAVIVDQVCWSGWEPDVIDVFTEEPDSLLPWPNWRKAGWRIG